MSSTLFVSFHQKLKNFSIGFINNASFFFIKRIKKKLYVFVQRLNETGEP